MFNDDVIRITQQTLGVCKILEKRKRERAMLVAMLGVVTYLLYFDAGKPTTDSLHLFGLVGF